MWRDPRFASDQRVRSEYGAAILEIKEPRDAPEAEICNREAAAKADTVALVVKPQDMADVLTDPRWFRGQGTLGEDPEFVSRAIGALVRGLAAAGFRVVGLDRAGPPHPPSPMITDTSGTPICRHFSVERAIATRRLLPAAVAIVLGALTLTVGPSGLICFAALIAGARPIVQIVARRAHALGGRAVEEDRIEPLAGL